MFQMEHNFSKPKIVTYRTKSVKNETKNICKHKMLKNKYLHKTWLFNDLPCAFSLIFLKIFFAVIIDQRSTKIQEVLLLMILVEKKIFKDFKQIYTGM